MAVDVEVPALPTVVPGPIPNGVWTLINEKTNAHETVKVATIDSPDKPGLHGRRAVYVMTGPDNIFNYTGVAFLNTIQEEYEEEYDFDEPYESVHDDCDVAEPHTHSVVRKRTLTRPKDILQVWKRQAGTNNHKIANAWLRIITDGVPGYRFEMAKHCIKCSRLLTNPDSIEVGIGPKCAQGGMDE